MTELVVLSAPDEARLVEEIARLVAFIDRVPDVSLVDIAYTCSLAQGESVLALIAETTADLRARLASALARLQAGTLRRIRDKSGTYWFRDHLLGNGKGKLAFVYPGVMAFYPDMMRDLAIAHPECRMAFDELEEALAEDPEFSPSAFIFPPAQYYRRDADIFSSGAYAQALVANYAACDAVTRLLTVAGIAPDGTVGFGGGDLVATMRSGAAGLSPTRVDRVRALRDVYRLVYKAVNHGGLPEVAVVTVLLRHPGELDAVVAGFPPDKVMLTVDFSPRQKTFAVRKDFEAEALAAFSAAGVRARKLELDRPFNTPLCASIVPSLRKYAATWMKQPPTLDLYSCATGGKVPAGLKAARDDSAELWAKPVLFEATVRQMYADGYRVFLEVGPRGLMTRAVEDTLRGETHAAIAVNSIHRSGRLQAQHAIGQLLALGAKADLSRFYAQRKARRLDFDAVLSLEVRQNSEMHLSRTFPKLTLLATDAKLTGASVMASPTGRGARANARAAVLAQQKRLQRQFDFGAMYPLVSDADTVESSPGVLLEISKTFKISDCPFIGDSALGSSQLSYSDPNLRGLVLLTLPLGAEVMAEVAQQVVPNLRLVTIQDLNCRRMVAFSKGRLALFVRGERVASGDASKVAVRVLIRDDAPNSAYTWPVMEATFLFGSEVPTGRPASPVPLTKPRGVHWSGRDIYPLRLCRGKRLRGIRFAELWSESGIDYDVQVPQQDGNVTFSRFPIWTVNPVLLETIVSGFPLWRSHERFQGAFSFPFRMRRLEVTGVIPEEGATLKCYLRLTSVTPKSHLCDIVVTDGNGKELMRISGWEELTERVPVEYRDLILQPPTAFLTEPLSVDAYGKPATDVATAFVTEIPYPIFERNEELWLRTLSHVILSSPERKNFAEMTGSTSRRVEWLFGRVAAKEAVRRFLKDFYQARWSDADVKIWADDSGKPHALGDWADFLSTRLDIAIAHTSQFVVAVAAANARVGVDVECTNRDLSEEFTAGVFTPEELELVARAVNPAHAVIRFWCAKEAVSKALGTGIRYSPREMVVCDYQPDLGRLVMRLEGAWAEAFKNFRGRDIEVSVRTVRDHALATCFIPAALFAEDADYVENRTLTEIGSGEAVK